MILIQPVVPRQQQPGNDVLAGKPIQMPSSSVAKGNDPLQIHDAWADFRMKKGLPMVAAPSTMPDKQARDIDGPTTARLNEQDKKLDQFAKRLEQLQQQQEYQVEQSKEAFNKVETAFKHQDQKVDHLEKQFETRLTTMQQNNDMQMQTLHQAIEANTKASGDQFRVIREMLQAASNEPRKAAQKTPNASPNESGDEKLI